MKSLKFRLISAIRDYCIEIKGNPTIVVHKALALQHGGILHNLKCDDRGFIVLRIGPNAVRNYIEKDNDLIFDVTVNGEEKRILIPIISIAACFEANNPDDGIEFNLIMDVAKFKREFDKAVNEANQIVSRYLNNDEQRKE